MRSSLADLQPTVDLLEPTHTPSTEHPQLADADRLAQDTNDMPDNKAGPLSISAVTQQGATVVVPTGEIDLGGSPMLRAELKKHIVPNVKLVVDLAGVPYMDSSGLATLVEALQRIRQANGTLRVCGLSPRVKSIFEIAKLEAVFKIFPSRAEALAQ